MSGIRPERGRRLAADDGGPLGPMARDWRAAFGIGLVTTILGILVTVDPASSLVFVAIVVGVEFVVSGIFRLFRGVSDGGGGHGILSSIVGVVLILVGLFLLRHIDLTLLLVSTLVGIFWVVTGIIELTIGVAAPAGLGARWLILTGALATVAGIVVLVYPVGTLLTLALLVGIWLIIRGVGQMMAAWALRRTA